MSEAPAQTPASEDLEHLRLLSIFHYVIAALAALCATLPLIHVTLGIVMLVSPPLPPKGGEAFPAAFAWVFIVMGAIFFLFGWAFAISLAISGRRLGRRTHHTYCFVVACLSTIFFPFGTALGVFTIIVLSRPSVKTLFAAGATVA